jgi:hypothetical protein
MRGVILMEKIEQYNPQGEQNNEIEEQLIEIFKDMVEEDDAEIHMYGTKQEQGGYRLTGRADLDASDEVIFYEVKYFNEKFKWKRIKVSESYVNGIL